LQSTTTTTTPGIVALIIDPDGPARVERLYPYDWEALRELLGGWIETIGGQYEGANWTAMCDEEGGLKGLPRNAMASALAREIGWRFGSHGVLVGRVIFLGLRGTGEVDVPDVVLQHARAIGVLPGGDDD
jgi:Domain of unknown function (DUF3846)